MNPIVRRLIVLLVIIFVLEWRTVAGEVKSPPYFVKQPSPTEILYYLQSDDLSVKRSIDLPCEAKGDPEPHYFWTKNGVVYNWASQADRIIQENGKGTLKINAPISSDAGQYQCFAENIWGIAASNSVFARKIELGSFPNEKPYTVELHEGPPFNLSCPAPRGYPKPVIDWFIQDASGKLVDIDNPRITVDPEGTLWFSNTTFDDVLDDSIYTCAVTSTYISDVRTGGKVKLDVIPMDELPEDNEVAPIPQYTSKPEEKAVLNKRARLYCIFGGTPLPKITWYKNGKLIQFRSGTTAKDNGKSIEIRRVTLSDEGNYTCEASNGVGNAISHTIVLKVQVSPSFIKKPESVTIDEEETVEFHCQAAGNPTPEIIWMHNGKPLSEASFNPRRAVSSNSIIIEKLLKNDTGNYGCNATNSVGYVYQDAFVNVLAEPPNITQVPQDREIIEGGTVKLSCRAVGSPKPQIIWMRNGAELNGDRLVITKSGDLTITNASPADTGEYTCLAQNKISSVSISANLTVRQRTRIPSQLAPHDTEIRAGETAIFKCSALVDPALDLTISWLQNGDSIDFLDQHFVKNNDNSLSILNTTEQDSGGYACVASTRLDEAAAEASLIVQNIPNPPAIVSLSCDAKDAIISWKNTGDNRAPIMKYVIEYNTILVSDTWEVLSNTTPATETFTFTMAPWTNYTFRVFAVNKIGTSLPSQPSSVCYSSPPEIPYQNPKNVTIQASNHSKSMLVSWEPMPKTNHNGPGFHYEVAWKKDEPGAEWETQTIPEWEKEEYTIPNLSPQTKYLVKVTAGNDMGKSEPASEIMEYSTPADIPYKNPDNVIVQANHPTTLGISWKPMPKSDQNGPGFYYNISWKRDTPESEWQSEIIAQPETGEFAVPNVLPNEKYLVKVTSGNDQGPAAPVVEPFPYQTPPDVPYKNPENIVVQSSDPTTLKLSWKPMTKDDQNGPGFHYEVSWKKDTPEAEWKNQTIVESSTGEYSVSNLSPNTKYLMEVIAGNELGHSTQTAEIVEYNTPPAIPFKNPDNVTVRVINPTTLEISWKPAPKADHNGPGFHYNVSWKMNTPEDQWRSHIISESETGQYIIQNVLPYKKYFVSVVSGNDLGASNATSEPIECFTPATIPFKNPDNVTVRAIGPTNSMVSWKPMPTTEHNGPGFYYNVSWRVDTPEIEWESQIISEWETGEFTIDVPPFEKHFVTVVAGNAEGECDQTPVTMEGYFEEDVPLEAPTNLALVEIISSTKANISWTRVPKGALRGNFQGYKIESWPEIDQQKGNVTETIIEQNFDSVIIDKLTPNAKNKIRILVFNGKHSGPYSNELEIDTPEAELEPVQSMEANPLGSSALSLVWKPPLNTNGRLTGYKIHYQTVSETEPSPLIEYTPQITDPDKTRVKLSDLKPDTNYKIIIQATTNNGDGEKFEIEKKTQPAPSGPLIQPDFKLEPIVSKNSTAVEIIWLPCGAEVDPKNCSDQPIGSEFRVDYALEDEEKFQTVIEKNDDSMIIRDLQPNKEYKFVVSSVDGTLAANSSVKSFKTPEIPTSPEKRISEQTDQPEESTMEPSTTETSSPDLSITKIDERKYDSRIPDLMWIIVILSLILLTIVFILMLTYLKKLNQGDKYIVREQEAKNRRPDCPEDLEFQEISQPLNGDVPVDSSASLGKSEKDDMVVIPLN